MSYYHAVPSYSSHFGQATKMGGELYIMEANPRGLGPPPPNAYKRAVLRDPPKQFKALVLPPKKIGSGWAYGLRVISTLEDDIADRKSLSSRSVSSTSPYKDYEIWRRWDDCLWFQETLELEYSIQAREKRRRLEQGKGVKKNGVYIDSKQAASFDSLPPGPDPTSVSLDIHNYIPKLTKKASLFRANQATIDQRHQQFASIIEALLAPEVPALIEELRATSAVRVFFGWWRRDKDFARKHGPGKGKNPEIPILDSVPFYLDVSNSSQMFSSPQTTSRDLPQPRSKPSRRTTADPTASDSIRYSPRSYSRDNVLSRRRTTPAPTPPGPSIAISHAPTNGLHGSRPSSRASAYSVTSDELSPTVVMWDGQEQLSSDRISPNEVLNAFPQTPMVRETFENIQCPPSPEADSPVLGLEALPEVPGLELPPSQSSAHGHEPETRPPVTRSRGKDGRHRRAVVYPPEVASGEEVHEIPERSPTMTNTTESSRDSSLFSSRSLVPSWRTSTSDLPPLSSPRHSIDSSDAIDYSCTGSPVTPHTPWLPEGEALPVLGPAAKRNPRESIMTIDSIMSDTSVDQVLPRGVYMTPQPGDVSLMRTFSVGPRSRPHIFVPMSVPEEEVSLEDCDDVTLDSYLFGIEEMDTSCDSESEAHPSYRERSSLLPTSEQLPKPFQDRPPEQFHLPWLPPTPSTPHFPSSVQDGFKSPRSPISMMSTSTVSLKPISVKAYLTEDAIVMFRVAYETTYAEIRDKIYDKFVNQEGISLRPDFPLAYLVPVFTRGSPTSPASPGPMRKCAGSVGSPSTNQSSLLPIQSQEAWEDIVRESEGKLTLRVFE